MMLLWPRRSAARELLGLSKNVLTLRVKVGMLRLYCGAAQGSRPFLLHTYQGS